MYCFAFLVACCYLNNQPVRYVCRERGRLDIIHVWVGVEGEKGLGSNLYLFGRGGGGGRVEGWKGGE